MQRDVSVAKTLLQTISFLDADGAGLYRKEFYAAAKELLELQLDSGDLVTMVDYHLHLLETGGFVLCERDVEAGSGFDSFLLTWHGHDYLEGLVQ